MSTQKNQTIPLAAVQLSQKRLTAIKKLYPHFPLDTLYQIVVIDCPWKYYTDKIKVPYNTLTMDELKVLPIREITNVNCIVFMWTTMPMYDKALSLLAHWKLTYQTTVHVWSKINSGKPQTIPGTYSETSVECLLVATRGQTSSFHRENVRVQQLIEAPRQKHSEKPIEVMHAIKRKYKVESLKCLEIFARKRTLKEFDLYGDELTPRFQPASDPLNSIQLDLFGLAQEVIGTKQGRVGEIIRIFKSQSSQKTALENTSFLEKFVKDHIDQFAFSKEEFGLTDVLQHHINLEKDAKPIARAPYKVAPVEETFIRTEVKLLMELGCIEPSVSQWASPVVLVKKSNGDLRMCIDYRGLNKVTIRDQYPLPRIDQILLLICQGKIFTKLDLKSGFWQISVYYYDRAKTSFVCSLGTFQWKRMPFGLTNAPATFQRLMTMILGNLIRLKIVIVYIDDIIVFSQSEKEHFKHLSMVFQALEESNLKLGYDKCVFFQSEINILGHTVSNGNYKPLETRVQAITELARPKDVKGIQIFMGLVNYHGQFIKNLAKLASPLRELTKKNVQFKWDLPQENSFNQLKAAISTTPVLYIPLHDKLMILYTDFSEMGIGAVLAQEVKDNEERVIEYASRVLRKHEKNYPAYKGEVLAVSWAVAKFRQFLLQAPFKLVLDNQSAVDLLKQYRSPENLNNLQKTVLNWVLELQDYHFSPVHRPGTAHNNADALSRLVREGYSNQEVAETLAYLLPENPLLEEQLELNTLNWWGAAEGLVCIKCHKSQTDKNNDILICDSCGKGIHQYCHNPRITSIPQGPWYCYECQQLSLQLDTKDPTLDFVMHNYLKDGTIPEEYELQDRRALQERSQDYYLENYRLRLKSNGNKIPTLTERKLLLAQVHDFKGHTSPDSLLDTLKAEYYWPTMSSDVIKFVGNCTHCSQMNPKFVSNPTLHPTEKGDRPFTVLHVDLSGPFQIELTSHKSKYLFILVDSFSKWVELYPIPNKTAKTTANCMWDFVKRFGSPVQVITDKGKEFEGEFKDLLDDMRVQFLTISPRNPQANGMAERTVKTVKQILKKFVQSPTQDVEWDEAANAVQLSINTSNSQSTRFSPYEIVFGRKMAYPSSVLVDPPINPIQEPTMKDMENYLKALKESFKSIHPRALANIKQADDRNKQYYDRRHNKQQVELRFGDFVVVRIPKVETLGPKGKGPFQFLRYTNRDKSIAELVDPFKLQKIKHAGKVFISSATFKENTSNLALVKVDRSKYEFPEEDLQYVSRLEIQNNFGNYHKDEAYFLDLFLSEKCLV